MNIFVIVPGLLTIVGAILIFLPKQRIQQPPDSSGSPISGNVKIGEKILLYFFVVCLGFGIVTFIKYFHSIKFDGTFFYAMWLFLTMIFGMFVQVISANKINNNDLFDIKWQNLVYPLLFSIVVFYPIWGGAASSSKSFFSFYSAFLNGYFWEKIVTDVQKPKSDK